MTPDQARSADCSIVPGGGWRRGITKGSNMSIGAKDSGVSGVLLQVVPPRAIGAMCLCLQGGGEQEEVCFRPCTYLSSCVNFVYVQTH